MRNGESESQVARSKQTNSVLILETPGSSLCGTQVFSYRLNEKNIVTALQAPGASNLASFVGKPFERIFSNSELFGLLDALLRAVRRTGKICSIPFRCDTEIEKQRLLLTVIPLRGENLNCRIQSLATACRQAPIDFSKCSFLRMCSWCCRIHHPGEGWKEIEEILQRSTLTSRSADKPLTHTVCEDCAKKIEAAIDEL